ncbi:hypothetical protein [Celeribacter persicus]|uniref:Uncharacterized protein n=1 Tax=Celeribacter persicus TaxID=1651082 RepID=A0A2T5HJY3_9RHOB|nr:hypothetical protein [Celeribacter persicus]PTQ71874.1 hypothetical protein C8N42_10753 [Celeribacter persicus]
MKVTAEIIDNKGVVIISEDANVTQDGDLATLFSKAIAAFRRKHPDTSLFSDENHPGYTVRLR